MYYDQDYNTINLSAEELSVLRRQIDCHLNDLAVPELMLELEQPENNVVDGYAELDRDIKQSAEEAIKKLAAPDQVGMLSFSIGDRSISRLKLAWAKEDEDIAVLGRTGSEFTLALHSREQIFANVEQVLAIHQPLSSMAFNVTLSASAALLVVALADCYRADWFHSALFNRLPLGSYTFGEIEDHLKKVTDDFRWAMPFFAETIPVSLSDVLPQDEIEAGLAELAEMELISMDGDTGSDEMMLYKIGDELELISDGILNNAGKVSLTISSIDETGKLASEAVFWVRDANYLWMVHISGKEGAVANIDQETFEDVIRILLLPHAGTIQNKELQALVDGKTTGMRVQAAGEDVWPYSWEQLKSMAAVGSLKAGSLVWRKGMPDWVEANKIEGLI